MKTINRLTAFATLALGFGLALSGCQKMERPALGNYPKDANPPGGPLKFYVAFDGTTPDPLMNAVDSIRANFPSQNNVGTTDGVRGKAMKGENKKFLKYTKPNDWAAQAESFTISFWYRKNGQTKNNTGTNGPEYIMSFPSSNGHWSGSSMLVFLEGNNTSGQVKVMIADKTNADNWFTWEGGQSIAGLLDNNWHHVALVYDAPTSTMRLYVDGAQNPNTKTWNNHGPINIDNSKISEMRIGSGPSNAIDSDDWLASTFKGDLDQFRLYSVALTQAQVSALFTGKQ